MSTSTNKGGMQKTLSLWNFFTIGFGAIIGTGWVLLVGDWMVFGGGPVAAMIAFIIGAIFLLPIGAVFGELTAAIPISGGIVEYVDRTYGNTMSFITGWFLALGNAILCPWEAIAISTLVSDMFGDLLPILRSVKLYSIMGAVSVSHCYRSGLCSLRHYSKFPRRFGSRQLTGFFNQSSALRNDPRHGHFAGQRRPGQYSACIRQC